jgi:hypothetical protein
VLLALVDGRHGEGRHACLHQRRQSLAIHGPDQEAVKGNR